MSHQLNDLQRLQCMYCSVVLRCYRNDVDKLVEHMEKVHPDIVGMSDVKCQPSSASIVNQSEDLAKSMSGPNSRKFIKVIYWRKFAYNLHYFLQILRTHGIIIRVCRMKKLRRMRININMKYFRKANNLATLFKHQDFHILYQAMPVSSNIFI